MISISRALALPALLAAAVTALPKSKPMQLMGTVGCLVQEQDDKWFLTDATEPVPAVDIDENLDPTAKGEARFHLIGTLDEFSATKHRGHKVRIKGLPIKAAPESRINITSLKHISPTCE